MDVNNKNETKKQVEQTLLELLDATAEEILRRVKSGEAGPQDISNAIRLLKENDIDIHIREGDASGLLDKLEDLPVSGENVVKMEDKKQAQ